MKAYRVEVCYLDPDNISEEMTVLQDRYINAHDIADINKLCNSCLNNATDIEQFKTVIKQIEKKSNRELMG